MSKEQIKAARRNQAGNYAFLAPAAIIYLSVIVIPLIYSIYISFHKWNGVKAMEPVGIANYIRLFTEDDVFKTAFRNNLVWILLSVVVATALALAFALVLAKKFRGRTFFRGVFYFPCVVAPIAVAIIWRWMYNADFGFINSLMEALGIDYAQTWLSNPKTSLLALFAAALWQMVGEPMIFFLAGLQAVPSELYDAALVDGATPAQKFFYVTLPMIKETFVIVIATLVINAVHVYDIVQGLTNGGPNNATQVLSTYMYTQTFRYNNLGYGAAISIVMVLMMMVIVVPYIIATTKED